jgi:hypothetical protein
MADMSMRLLTDGYLVVKCSNGDSVCSLVLYEPKDHINQLCTLSFKLNVVF